MPVRNSRLRLTGWLAFAALLHAASAFADVVRLDVSEIVLKNTSKVTFTVTPSTTTIDNGQLVNALTVQTERRRFEVRVPTAVIPWWHTRQSFVATPSGLGIVKIELPTGQISAIPSPGFSPASFAAGGDGSVWAVDLRGNRVVQLDATGKVIQTRPAS